MKKVNIIGGGRVGKTLGYLLQKYHCLQLNQVLNKHLATASAACAFIGQGEAVSTIGELTPSDVYLISVSDDQISHIVEQLSASNLLRPGNIVFHCSGALSSDVLAPLEKFEVAVASLHPIKSFSTPKDNINNFSGTTCTLEGDEEARSNIASWMTTIGAKVVVVNSTNKLLYHAACVFSSNYFVTIIEQALQLLEATNIDRETAFCFLEPLVLGTWQQIKSSGTVQALTGPIARGDTTLVTDQMACVNQASSDIATLYEALAKATLKIAKQKNPGKNWEDLTALLA